MTPADSVDEGSAPASDRAELVVSLEALLATARTQLADLRTTLATSIGFLQGQDHRD
jgi:hypothetical protein